MSNFLILPVLTKEEIFSKLNSIDNLPTLPIVIKKIINAVESQETRIRDLTDIINKDQVIAAKVLKIANSAYYAQRQKIKSIDDAVMVIGFNEIKRIVMSVNMIQAFPGRLQSRKFEIRDFWIHSLSTAYAAKIIGEAIHESDIDDIYTAGLLHDIGKIVINQFFPKYFTVIVHYVFQNNQSFHETENEILGCDHTLIGGWLAKKWNLSPNLTSAIKSHHTILIDETIQESYKPLNYIICLSDIIVRKINFGIIGEQNIDISDELLNCLGIDNSMLSDICCRLKDANEVVTKFFN